MIKSDIQLFGGRGASSGISEKGNKYGSQYKTIKKVENIKFLKAKHKNAESLFETKTKGRIYVLINDKDKITKIYYYDNNKRKKSIDLLHSHEDMIPHTHHGYVHNENDGKKGATALTNKEKKMVEKVYKIWYNTTDN